MYIVLFVLDDPSRLDKILTAWTEGGIKGATVIESTGLHRHQRKLIPMRYLYSSPLADEKDNVTIFAIVDDKEASDHCLALIESVVGDLNEPNTGVFAAWPLSYVKGISGNKDSEGD
ncbi:MAG: hypothetical protein FD147_1687 [Chloroflexi bacterium]|nr:MAG: hypothetical protein FD147_1687 [Chloroflexota bacterium]MBA4376505.1 hypothetical protein [Anaerolinea sp.]